MQNEEPTQPLENIDDLQAPSAEATQAEMEALRAEIGASRAKADEYLEGWQRARADFANYKKRVERDQAQTAQMVTGSILKRYLEILDDLDRALKNHPQDGDGALWANGIELIYRKLLTILENEGVKPMDPLGKDFDPTQHEAIISEDNDQYHSGQVTAVLQQGYLLGERVLRPAMVKVAR